jgi:hypothetical protein
MESVPIEQILEQLLIPDTATIANASAVLNARSRAPGPPGSCIAVG